MTEGDRPSGAVLAEENAALHDEVARLRDELQLSSRDLSESLEQQTASAEILRAIASAPGELDAVLQAVADNASRLCGAPHVVVYRVDGDGLRSAAGHGPLNMRQIEDAHVLPIDRGSISGTAVQERRVVQVDDFAAIAGDYPESPFHKYDEVREFHSMMSTPLMREGQAIGTITVGRTEVRPFTNKQRGLLASFADQAVIAIENARLLDELNARMADLSTSLERQTATSEVLRVIASSPGEAEGVLDTIARTAQRLLAGSGASITRMDGSEMRQISSTGAAADVETLRERLNRFTPFGRAVLENQTIHVPDILAAADEYPNAPAVRGLAEIGTIVCTPLTREDQSIGGITVVRSDVRPFTAGEIELLESFADQAVIAIENARLLSELHEALERRTATADVLAVISSSPGEVQPVFEAMLNNAVRLCNASEGSVFSISDDVFRRVATHGSDADLMVYDNVRVMPASPPGQMLETLKTIHVPDMSAKLADLPYAHDEPAMAAARALVERGARSALWVPMIRDETAVGAFVLRRREAAPFSEAQIALVETFASQAVIAIENARLLDELRNARDTAERAVDELRDAQASLIHAEKMASLGQLTAGIAHEIKNPLNFVNNFAGLSVELLGELKETAGPAFASLADDERDDVDEVMEMLTGNLEKVAEHGKRADGIVKSMLAHSRGGGGERQSVDLNALIEESLNLAYHGARAQDQDFNITMERDFDTSLGPIEVVPQELTRVLLNLFGNGFYAAKKRARETDDSNFQPILKVSTCDTSDGVEIRIRDNGTGIPEELQEKLFEPFFTTKPTGEGTGLGLSISYEIVTKQHGGTIEVESVTGEFTEFRIRLPRQTRD